MSMSHLQKITTRDLKFCVPRVLTSLCQANFSPTVVCHPVHSYKDVIIWINTQNTKEKKEIRNYKYSKH